MNFSVCGNATKINKNKNPLDMFYNILRYCGSPGNRDNFVFIVKINNPYDL